MPGKKRKPQQGKSRNLLTRLRDHETDVLLFMIVDYVTFTNNQGERDLRMNKVKQKISGCFRSKEAADNYCRVRSYISTCEKHNMTASKALETLFTNKLPDFFSKDKYFDSS